MAQWWESSPLAEPDQASPSAPAQGANWWDAAPLAEGEPTTYDTYVKPVVDGISDAAQGVYTAVAGKHDPKFKGLPGIERAAGIIDGNAEMTAVSDAAYGDVMKKRLGDRYIGSERDANGYEVITFRGKDGEPRQAYVNRPGLDGQDVNRALSASVPYMAAASGVGRLARGMGTVTNMALQGLTAGSVSVGQDLAAQSLGSKQDIDVNRALVGGALGAGGELAGRVLGPFVRKMFGDRSLVGKDGKLTPKGIALAKKEGVDPAIVDKELAEELQRRAAVSADPAEALVAAQTDRFSIPTTKGQRTNDPQMLITEKDIRAGTLGDRAKERLRNLDTRQKDAIEAAARGEQYPFPPNGAPNNNAIAPRLAPDRGISDQSKDVLGGGIKSGLDSAKKNIGALENKAWKATENIAPRAGAFESMQGIMRGKLNGRLVDEKLTPAAHQMVEELKAFKNGLPSSSSDAVSEIVGQQTIRYVDQMRRRLMLAKESAATTGDRAAASKVYQAFDDWMVDAAEKNLLTGAPGAAQAVLNARRTTAELRGVLQPRQGGKKTAAARILDKVSNAETGEEVLTALLGASGPKAALPQGAVEAVRRFKAATTKLGGSAGKAAWNDARLSHWLKLVSGKNGDMLPNGTLITSIKDAFHNQPSLMNALYSPKEQTLMKQFAQAIKSATPRDPNPSGSGTAIRGLFPNLVKGQLQVAGSRNQLASTATGSSHKRLMAVLYRSLARVVPQVLDGKNVLGSAAASRVTTQALTPKTPPSLAGYASAFTPSATSDRTQQFSPNRMLAPRR